LDGADGRSADWPLLSPRWAIAEVLPNSTSVVRRITDKTANFIL
jgi:hypothetical protein